MALEISPEPSETERKAIVRALELEAEQSAEPSPWREAGLGPERPEDEPQAGALPRPSPGATPAESRPQIHLRTNPTSKGPPADSSRPPPAPAEAPISAPRARD